LVSDNGMPIANSTASSFPPYEQSSAERALIGKI